MITGRERAAGRRAREQRRRKREGERPPAPGGTSDPAVLRMAAIIIAAVALSLLAMGFVMALAMGNMMDNHGMMMGGGNAPQGTPVVLQAAEVSVDIRGYAFSPPQISIAAGTKVTWTNRDGAPHTATEKEKAWDSGMLNQGKSYTRTFDKPGTYQYYCTFHTYMKGTVVVR